jgi:chorismate synthase
MERTLLMSGSRIGKNFSATTWGESHGPAIGAVVDGCPAGIPLSVEDIQKDLDRRKPGESIFATKRKEEDLVQILSGVFEGKTTGAPISMIILNTDHRSRDYSEISGLYRPGHADAAYDLKYGFRDYRGGGRSSGRETAGRVAAGAIARKLLEELGIHANAYVISIGGVSIDRSRFSLLEASSNPLCMPDKAAYEKAAAELRIAMEEGDSLGGVIECVVSGVEPGLGEPVFEKLQAILGQAMFSIGAVKGVEFGLGFAASDKRGSCSNDPLRWEGGRIVKTSNNSGGSLGGITDGSDISFRVAVKPTPSISRKQETASVSGENVELRLKGRHDPVIAPRACVVVEAMACICIADLLLQSLLSNIGAIKILYSGEKK